MSPDSDFQTQMFSDSGSGHFDMFLRYLNKVDQGEILKIYFLHI